jgi:diaminopimelate epimerase
MLVKFIKMHGAGNDFLLVDEWKQEAVPEKEKPNLVARICDRHLGVGSDGVIFIQPSKKHDAKFHFFNPDGSLAEMCGNGIRCFAKFLYDSGLVHRRGMSIETLAGVKSIKLTVEDGKVNGVKVGMGAPQLKRKEAQVSGRPEEMMVDEEVQLDGLRFRITAVGMGNPHAVLFTENVDEIDLVPIASRIRNFKKLFPNGINVHIVQTLGKNEFKIRTYERGVENETLACGTGICASAVAAVLNQKANPAKPIAFHAKGGILEVSLEMKGKSIKEVYLTGPAENVFEGIYPFKK